jgi:hypothetical protein
MLEIVSHLSGALPSGLFVVQHTPGDEARMALTHHADM